MGRFLSEDPITQKYPELTPYQFASNTPIQAIDLDGLEGIKYNESYKQNGKTKIKIVVEVDVYVGISKLDAKHYKIEDVDIIKSGLEIEYNRLNPKSGKKNHFRVNGKIVEFRFNMRTFNIDEITLTDFAKNLQTTTLVESSDLFFIDQKSGNPVYRKSVKGVAMGKRPAPTKGELGETSANRIAISMDIFDTRHTESHEMGHFFLLGSSTNPNTHIEHQRAGGIFTYKEVDEDGNVVTPIEKVNISNVEDFLRNIPNINSNETTTSP